MNEIIARLDKIIELLEAQNAARVVLDEKPAPVAKRARTKALTTDQGKASQLLVKAYCDAFKARYGAFPIVEGKTLGLSRYVLQAVSLDRAQDLVQAFLQMDDKYFITMHHSFSCFVQSLSKVAVALAFGSKDPNDRTFWQNVFKDSHAGTDVSKSDKTPPKSLA